MNSFDKGQTTEAAVLAQLLRRGFCVALPVGVKRFDLVVEIKGKLLKAQVKTGRRKNGLLTFNTAVTNPVKQTRRPYTKKQVDVFLVLDGKSDTIYKVPFKLVGKTECGLRLEPPKRKTKQIHLASDYKL
jgi:hypothetical protein